MGAPTRVKKVTINGKGVSIDGVAIPYVVAFSISFSAKSRDFGFTVLTEYGVTNVNADAVDMRFDGYGSLTDYLSTYRTVDLVEELSRRPGVEKQVAEPYQDVAVTLNGPAVALIVTD